MVGVILAAGNGIRLKESTGVDCCKVLTKINGRHLIEFALDNLIELGIKKAIIVVGKYGDEIKSTIGSEYEGLSVSYVYQRQQKGLINAMMQAVNEIRTDEDIVLQLADEIFTGLKSEEIKTHISTMLYDFYCGVTYEDNPEKIKNNFSVETDEKSVLLKCTEKPAAVINNIKGTGFCIFSHNTLQMLKSIYDENENKPNDLCDFMNYLIAENKHGKVFCIAEREFNINTSSNLEEAKAFFEFV